MNLPLDTHEDLRESDVLTYNYLRRFSEVRSWRTVLPNTKLGWEIHHNRQNHLEFPVPLCALPSLYSFLISSCSVTSSFWFSNVWGTLNIHQLQVRNNTRGERRFCASKFIATDNACLKLKPVFNSTKFEIGALVVCWRKYRGMTLLCTLLFQPRRATVVGTLRLRARAASIGLTQSLLMFHFIYLFLHF